VQFLAALQSNWTVGLLATVGTILCVVAADTGAYFVGRSLGRTKLTDVSPKKTVEGAVGGLASSIGMALLLHKLVAWPAAPLEACTMGVSPRLCVDVLCMMRCCAEGHCDDALCSVLYSDAPQVTSTGQRL
jgi:CDP-diglyceride synthetase